MRGRSVKKVGLMRQHVGSIKFILLKKKIPTALDPLTNRSSKRVESARECTTVRERFDKGKSVPSTRIRPARESYSPISSTETIKIMDEIELSPCSWWTIGILNWRYFFFRPPALVSLSTFFTLTISILIATDRNRRFIIHTLLWEIVPGVFIRLIVKL